MTGVTRILQGDVFDRLAEIDDGSVHCVVTSPPYWGLRDYGVAGQMGLEPTYQEHIDVMVRVFREIRRVLRDDGTLWLNYGDVYATSPNGRAAADIQNDDRTFRDKPFSTVQGALKPKDLAMMPNRVAIALQEDGWLVRSEIVWAKTNSRPDSAKDRPAFTHEKIFLLTKSDRYFYDREAVKEPVSGTANPRRKDGQTKPAKGNDGEFDRRAGTWVNTYMAETRNMRNVWLLPIFAYPDAHFATFPPEIPRRCILAGCPVGGTVLDPFGGAGTTGLVAQELDRNALLIELNPDYVEIARKRLGLAVPDFLA